MHMVWWWWVWWCGVVWWCWWGLVGLVLVLVLLVLVLVLVFFDACSQMCQSTLGDSLVQ